jgi:hypothetical protein
MRINSQKPIAPAVLAGTDAAGDFSGAPANMAFHQSESVPGRAFVRRGMALIQLTGQNAGFLKVWP